MTTDLQIKVSIQVLRPPHTVFEAIADPAQMSRYFISESTGRIEEGKTLTWKFPEFEMKFPVRVGKVEKDKYLSWYWQGEDGNDLLVEITLQARGSEATVVHITEKQRKADAAGIKWLAGNTEGWANFLACLKAWLEYGINLRKGAFDYRGES